MEEEEDRVKNLANLWFIEYYTKRLCQSFLKINGEKETSNRAFENSCAVLQGIMISLRDIGQNKNALPKHLINMSELCIRVAKKNLVFKETEELRSLNGMISDLCIQFHVSESLKDCLVRYFNSQSIMQCFMCGDKEKAQDLFLELERENLVFFEDDLKSIVLVQDSELLGIPVHLQYHTFFNVMQRYVSFIMDKLGDSFLKQIADKYLCSEEDDERLDQKELLQMFKHHKLQNEGHSTITGIQDLSGQDTNGKSKGKKSRKLFNHNQSTLDQSTDPHNRAEGVMAHYQDTVNPGESTSEETRPQITRKRQRGYATATRAEDSDSDESAVLPGKRPKEGQHGDCDTNTSGDGGRANTALRPGSNGNENTLKELGLDSEEDFHSGSECPVDVSPITADDPASPSLCSNLGSSTPKSAKNEHSEWKTTAFLKKRARAGNAAKNTLKTSGKAIEETKHKAAAVMIRSGGRRKILISDEDDTDASHDNDMDSVDPSNNPKEAPRPGRRERDRLDPAEEPSDDNSSVANNDSASEDESPYFNPAASLSEENRLRRALRSHDHTTETAEPTRSGYSRSYTSSNRISPRAVTGNARASQPHRRPVREPDISSNEITNSRTDQRNSRGNQQRENSFDFPDNESDGDSRVSSFGELDSISSSLVSAATSKKRRPFSKQEEGWLLHGVRRYGVGNWKRILKRYDFQGRTAVNLKDKWRNMLKRQEGPP